MLTRRLLFSAGLACTATEVRGQGTVPVAVQNAGPPRPGPEEASFARFLAALRTEGRRAGISEATLRTALAGLHPVQRVIELDRKQPEFTLTWQEYRSRIVSESRVATGRAAVRDNAGILRQVYDRYGVDAGVIVGIWGLESNYGAGSGGFNVVQALATLAWEGRRAAFFRDELMAALRIIDHGDVSVAAMQGSYAGAMGQPQFMPSSYLRYAVDFEGTGKRDIWNSKPDVLASIANYLAQSGWKRDEPWGQRIRLPQNFDPSLAGRSAHRPLGEWMTLGVRRDDGGAFSRTDISGAIVLPDGINGEAFMTYQNFMSIRRYNPSDFYALSVGLIGNGVLA